MTTTFKPFKYLNCTTKFKKIKNENLHNEFIDQYEEIKPYQKNKITGEILNNTDKYIYKKIEPRNIYKEIQSMAKEADIITKIKNMTPAGKEKLSSKNGIYLDTTKFGNLHEEHVKLTKLEQELAIAEKEYEQKQEELKKTQIIEEYKKQEAIKAAAAKETK